MSSKNTYYAPRGGLPPQTQLLTDRAVMTEAYAIIPRRVFTDIVTSTLPFWDNMRMVTICKASWVDLINNSTTPPATFRSCTL